MVGAEALEGKAAGEGDGVPDFDAVGEEADLEHLMPPPDRMATIRAAFEHTRDIRLTPVRELLGEDYSYDELALARIGLMLRGFFVRNGESFAIAEAPTVAAC